MICIIFLLRSFAEFLGWSIICILMYGMYIKYFEYGETDEDS